MNEKSRHHPLARAFETERRLYAIMRERHERVREESWCCRQSQAEWGKASYKAWEGLLVSLGVEFHDQTQPMRPDIIYVNDPAGPGFKLLVVPEDLALKILTLGCLP